MKLQDLKNKTILFFGKSRAFAADEFNSQLKHHNISVVKEYEENLLYAVDGSMMNPYEQNASEALYEKGGVTFISIDELERELVKEIDEDTLLMSLKLSHDKERLKSFIQNGMISDELFLKLLKLYSWSGEDFFENDNNRDITAALIRRFYENIERNHNVEYATLGLMHLIAQCKNEKLIEVIFSLEPIQKSLSFEIKDSKFNILRAIATHSYTPKSVIKTLIKKSNTYIKVLIAMRSNCDVNMQQRLFEDGDDEVLEALSYNTMLDKKIAKVLIRKEKYIKNIAKYIELDEEIFIQLLESCSVELAKNESLTYLFQERLISLHSDKVRVSLASNTNLDEKFINELVSEGSEDVGFAIYENLTTPQQTLEEAYDDRANHFALAHNKNTPKKILTLLSESDNAKVLEGLAKNESTPIDVLYQLQLDSRFERFVKENTAFGKHIQSENIGWLV